MKIIFKDIVNIYFYKKFNFIYSLLLFFIFYFLFWKKSVSKSTVKDLFGCIYCVFIFLKIKENFIKKMGKISGSLILFD